MFLSLASRPSYCTSNAEAIHTNTKNHACQSNDRERDSVRRQGIYMNNTTTSRAHIFCNTRGPAESRASQNCQRGATQQRRLLGHSDTLTEAVSGHGVLVLRRRRKGTTLSVDVGKDWPDDGPVERLRTLSSKQAKSTCHANQVSHDASREAPTAR